MSQATKDLNWMIKPIDRAAFIQSHWARIPLRISRNDSGYYDSVFSERDIECALYSACQVPGAVVLFAHDQHLRKCRTYAAAQHAFSSGESLRIEGAQRFSRGLALFCRAVEEDLTCPVKVNMYLSPGGTQALRRHYDTHDVFILQIHGEKKWRLFGPPIEFPIEYLPPLRCERQEQMTYQMEQWKSLNAQNHCVLTEEFVLEKGDFLYLPRGHWHEAQAEPEHISCHLAVGSQSFTYVDLLTKAITQAASHDVELRKPLPPGFGIQADSRSIAKEQILAIIETLLKRIDPEAALREIAEIFERSRRTVGRGLLESHGLPDPNEIELDFPTGH